MAKSRHESEILQHVQRYVHAVFADRLRKEGFKSTDGHEFCWYRFVNDEIFQTICFYTRYPFLPVMLEFGYGIHSLFQEPFVPKSPYMYTVNHPLDQFVWTNPLFNKDLSSASVCIYSPEILVYCPDRPGRGLDILEEEILPLMNCVKTVTAAYEVHKHNYLKRDYHPVEMRFNYVSEAFLDEVIHEGDCEIYPYCSATLDRFMTGYRNDLERCPDNKAFQKKHAIAVAQKCVLDSGAREEYLPQLEERKKGIIKKLKRRYNHNR